MKILITGGAGFIGSHVADILTADKNNLIVLDNLSTGKKDNIPSSAEFYEKSITDPSIAEIFKKKNLESSYTMQPRSLSPPPLKTRLRIWK